MPRQRRELPTLNFAGGIVACVVGVVMAIRASSGGEPNTVLLVAGVVIFAIGVYNIYEGIKIRRKRKAAP